MPPYYKNMNNKRSLIERSLKICYYEVGVLGK